MSGPRTPDEHDFPTDDEAVEAEPHADDFAPLEKDWDDEDPT